MQFLQIYENLNGVNKSIDEKYIALEIPHIMVLLDAVKRIKSQAAVTMEDWDAARIQRNEIISHTGNIPYAELLVLGWGATQEGY
jgi:hypothetical protein